MIARIVNADFEAIISLSIGDSEGNIYAQDAIVDTDFKALSDQNMKNELRHNESLTVKAFSSLL
ncbi:hypothetical protein [Microcystis aeruginosa]|jgi:hypothetical protein|uniref:hypothetical protein n=1 Tax=Microcystis aeruginosa TaxID=1126 RepID=UPI000261AE09|nr:hypothetical protein [Microcystis aeruginosa]CCI09164.1 hypothetical protein MICAD_3780015 [Microcystis aeruginosa PCC 7941]